MIAALFSKIITITPVLLGILCMKWLPIRVYSTDEAFCLLIKVGKGKLFQQSVSIEYFNLVYAVSTY
jgi:hypothetical protein